MVLFEEEVLFLEEGFDADVNSGNADRAAAKFAAVAHARIQQRRMREAIAAADRALANSKAVTIRFLAARVFIEADDIAKARTLIAGFAPELQAEPQAYAYWVRHYVAHHVEELNAAFEEAGARAPAAD